MAHSHDGPALTYLLKVDGVTGDSTIKGYEGYFTVDEFTFNELTRLANGGGGAVTGRAQFDPLMVDIAGLAPGLVALLKDAATGKHIPSVELVGLQAGGKGELQKVYDLKLGNVTVAGVCRRRRARYRDRVRLHQGDRDHQRTEPGRLARCRPDRQLQRRQAGIHRSITMRWRPLRIPTTGRRSPIS